MRWRHLIMKVEPSDREKGVGLVMVVLASALVAAIVATTTTMMSNKTKERVIDSRRAMRLSAYEFVKSSMSDPAALRVSAGYDTNLGRCLGLTAGTCNGGTSGTNPAMRAFRLRVPFSRTQFNVPVSGLSNADREGRYDSRGRLGTGSVCNSFSQNCPYHVRTWYWAQCANNTSTCPDAVRVFMLAQIKQRTAVREGTQQNFMFPRPSNITLSPAPYENATFALTSDVKASIYMNCPAGSTMVGTSLIADPVGGSNAPPLNLAKCECQSGYMLDKTKGTAGYDNATKWPYCTMQLCDADLGEVLSEIDANGDLVCKIPNAADYSCTTQTTPSTGVVACPAGAKMRGLTQGDDCLIETTPGIGEHVTCDQMVITCCTKI